MKKIIITLTALLTMALNANAMSYEQARREALFLTDKMAYELNLTEDQYEAAYEINLDYLMSIDNRNDLYGSYWTQRNLDLSYILLDWQYNTYCTAVYFYRPLYWEGGYWRFGVYARYPHRDYYYYGYPHFWYSYRGGHSWRHNGGRSWYHGRSWGSSHRHGHGNHGYGMRDGYDKGDYRNRRPDGYSGRGRGHGDNGNGHYRDFDRGRDRGNNNDRMYNRNDRFDRSSAVGSRKSNEGFRREERRDGTVKKERVDGVTNLNRNDNFNRRWSDDNFSTKSRSDNATARKRSDNGFSRQSSTRSTAVSRGTFERRSSDNGVQSRPSGTFTPSRSSGSSNSSGSFSRPSRGSSSVGSGVRGGSSHGAGGSFGGRR
ncbi:MAG: hypothetical protein SOZ80_00325 [Prevotella sp.]|nr:hypothetical protein [Prevotella sp.]MDD7317448.1 hypothetical protein [Prevotellaceae bacterium]MDY4019216.1 hypothetical protein [Prevotella sp.]